jgi:tetratricopeptide (TPR) repeat protein
MRRLSVIITTVFALLMAAAAHAEMQGYAGTSAEMKMIKLIEDENLIQAREIAEKILLIDSTSFTANYAMGVIVSTAEANLPKAYFHLQRAKDSYERLHGREGTDEKSWRWHMDILSALIDTAGGLEMHEKQIEYLREYDALYTPKKTAYYAWPLMKLGRISEARKVIQKALREQSTDYDRSIAMNTLGVIELDLDNREEAYRLYKGILEKAGNESGYVTEKYNFAIAAHNLWKFDEAEKSLIKAAEEGGTKYESCNPWDSLAYYYTLEGRFEEAFGALRNMIKWGLRRVAYLDQQCISEENQTKAQFLLSCGYAEQAYSITKRLVDRPDRQGYSSSRCYVQEGASIQLNLAALLDYKRMLQERFIWGGIREKAAIAWTVRALETEESIQRSRLKAIIFNNRALYYTIIPHHPLGLQINEFGKPDIIDIAGRGLIGAEIINIRKSYRYRDLAEPYLKEFEGEIAFKSGNRKKAMADLIEAQQKLPPAEKILHARILLLTAKIRDDLGESDAALALYQKAYQICPSTFRHLNIRLPVTIRAGEDDGSLAGIKKHLAGSPRFSVRQGAFTIDVSVRGNTIAGDLLDNFGNRVFTASTARTGNRHLDISRFLDEFHQKAFAAQINASLSEINSLDGTNIKNDEMRESIRDLLFEKKPGR